ncbi:hypothetical protein Tco_0592466 [Tanacetum coccineum]
MLEIKYWNLKILITSRHTYAILTWAIVRNGRPRIKGTSSSSGCDQWHLGSLLHAPPLNHHSSSYVVALGRGVLCCGTDMAYGLVSKRRISDKSVVAVDIDFTWSFGFVFVKLRRLPKSLSSASVEARISLMMFKFSSCLLADSVINLDKDSSIVSLRAGYEEFPSFCWYNPSLAALYCPPG